MNIEVNGKGYEVEPGQTILEAARAQGVYIPTLCYHAKTGGVGKCRVCVVEVEGRRQGRSGLPGSAAAGSRQWRL